MQILVADHDPDCLKLLDFFLTDAGYRVLSARSRRSIFETLQQHHPNLVLLGLTTSTTSSFDICRQIRKRSLVPIIFLSTQAQAADRVLGLTVGGDDYIAKPFEPTELLARIGAVLRRSIKPNTGDSAWYRLGDMTFDPLERIVLFNDGRITKLTHTETRVLAALIQHSGKVSTISQLCTIIWSTVDRHTTDILRITIDCLRAKIEPDTVHPRYITTVHSHGYRFTPQGDRSLVDGETGGVDDSYSVLVEPFSVAQDRSRSVEGTPHGQRVKHPLHRS
jgi:DNA-binding response OmpR family regulator